ncbi:hypothetical protein [Vibrio cyclitrophicus]|nr:hypothetical protein [Vibrio cyclitrophicus]
MNDVKASGCSIPPLTFAVQQVTAMMRFSEQSYGLTVSGAYHAPIIPL